MRHKLLNQTERERLDDDDDGVSSVGFDGNTFSCWLTRKDFLRHV